MAAEKAGLSISALWCDSTEFQIWGSEQYLRDIPLTPSNDEDRAKRTREGMRTDLFDSPAVRNMARRAQQLNRAGAGDQVCSIFNSAATASEA
jgi:hypothetical protein